MHKTNQGFKQMSDVASEPAKTGAFRRYRPDTSLRKKALVPGNARNAIRTATHKANEALEQLSGQFDDWMLEEANRLHACRLALQENGVSEPLMERLFVAAHDISGHAPTYGYPMAGMVAALLCELIEHTPKRTSLPPAVIDQHVNSVLAVVRLKIRGADDDRSGNIIEALQLLNLKTLQRLQARAQNEQISA